MGSVVRVLYFGAAMDETGRTEEDFVADNTTSLRGLIADKYPALMRIPFRMALNRTLLREESALRDNDIIAILPPFQGG